MGDEKGSLPSASQTHGGIMPGQDLTSQIYPSLPSYEEVCAEDANRPSTEQTQIQEISYYEGKVRYTRPSCSGSSLEITPSVIILLDSCKDLLPIPPYPLRHYTWSLRYRAGDLASEMTISPYFSIESGYFQLPGDMYFCLSIGKTTLHKTDGHITRAEVTLFPTLNQKRALGFLESRDRYKQIFSQKISAVMNNLSLSLVSSVKNESRVYTFFH